MVEFILLFFSFHFSTLNFSETEEEEYLLTIKTKANTFSFFNCLATINFREAVNVFFSSFQREREDKNRDRDKEKNYIEEFQLNRKQFFWCVCVCASS